jgi:hypothetical protein
MARLVSTLVSGAKDIPKNASWLAGKALPHDQHDHEQAHPNGTSQEQRSLAARATDAVRDVLPGGDSVEARLAKARQSAEVAREAEEQAVQAAEEAHSLVERADALEKEEQERLKEADAEQRAIVESRIAGARAEADERIQEAKRASKKAMAQEQEAADRRIGEARAEAEQAQERARDRYADATAKLADARSRADEAAALAQEAADRARADAERLSAEARREKAEADKAVAAAVGLRDGSSAKSASVTRTVRRTERPVLTEMSRSDLMHLAAQREVPGRSSMTKKQLLSALEKKQ